MKGGYFAIGTTILLNRKPHCHRIKDMLNHLRNQHLCKDADEQRQHGTHHELIRHRIEKGSKRGLLPQAAREETVEPVADSGHDEDTGQHQMLCVKLGEIEQDHKHGDQPKAQQR